MAIVQAGALLGCPWKVMAQGWGTIELNECGLMDLGMAITSAWGATERTAASLVRRIMEEEIIVGGGINSFSAN